MEKQSIASLDWSNKQRCPLAGTACVVGLLIGDVKTGLSGLHAAGLPSGFRSDWIVL